MNMFKCVIQAKMTIGQSGYDDIQNQSIVSKFVTRQEQSLEPDHVICQHWQSVITNYMMKTWGSQHILYLWYIINLY